MVSFFLFVIVYSAAFGCFYFKIFRWNIYIHVDFSTVHRGCCCWFSLPFCTLHIVQIVISTTMSTSTKFDKLKNIKRKNLDTPWHISHMRRWVMQKTIVWNANQTRTKRKNRIKDRKKAKKRAKCTNVRTIANILRLNHRQLWLLLFHCLLLPVFNLVSWF